ncbi:MAG: pyrroline-5-carboxylate reductase [Clostridia bacterium]|nr:pyrroline-5-carboxylate reductase [Clostridia bacterium]
MKNVTIIGAGNMGGALIKAISRSKSYKVLVYDADSAKAKTFAGKNTVIMGSPHEACLQGDIIILAVKPNIVLNVLDDLKNDIKEKLVVTIAAGVTLKKYEETVKGIRIIRCMPNMPALVQEGMTTLCKGSNATGDDMKLALDLLSHAGETLVIDEKNMDGATALAGSSPAYVFMMVEAMADAGVLEGLKREDAYKLASQAVLGSAKMLLVTKEHPGELKDRICSPGGTTIEAVKVLEQEGFRNALIKAINVCADKSKKLSGESK